MASTNITGVTQKGDSTKLIYLFQQKNRNLSSVILAECIALNELLRLVGTKKVKKKSKLRADSGIAVHSYQ